MYSIGLKNELNYRNHYITHLHSASALNRSSDNKSNPEVARYYPPSREVITNHLCVGWRLHCLEKLRPDAKDLNEFQDRFEVDITELPKEIDLS